MEIFVTSKGATLELRPVAPFVLAEAQSSIPLPEPPLEETNLGLVPNKGNPEYQKSIEKWQRQINELSYNAYLDFGVKRVAIPPEAQAQIDEYKEILSGPPYHKTLDYSDWVAYLTIVLMPDPKESSELVKRIQKLSNPTVEQVEAQRDQFQSTVEGSRPVVDQSPIVAAIG